MPIDFVISDYGALYRHFGKPNIKTILFDDVIRITEKGRVLGAFDVGMIARSDGRLYTLAGKMEAPDSPELFDSIKAAVAKKYTVEPDTDFSEIDTSMIVDFSETKPTDLDLRLVQHLFGPQNRLQVMYLGFHVFVWGGEGPLQSTPARELTTPDNFRRDFGYFVDVMDIVVNTTIDYVMLNKPNLPKPELTLEIKPQ